MSKRRCGAQGEWDGCCGKSTGITEYRRVEEALRRSEARLKDALSAAQMGVWEWTVGTDTVTWDENLYRITGRDSKLPAPSYKEHARIFSPESWEGLKAAVEKALATGAPFELDLETVRPDSSKRWLIARGEPVRDASGHITGLRGTMQDITERKRAEEALRESEARFRAIFENAAIGIALVDVHGHPVESNPALQRMLGYDKLELADMAFTEYTHPDDARASWDLFNGLVEGKREHYQMEKRFLRRDGQVVWGQLHVSVVRDQKGEFKYCFGMVMDITGRKRAEEALRESEARFRAIFENAAIGIALVDVRGHPVESSPALQKMLGYNKFEMSDMVFTEFTHPDDAQADWDLFIELAEGKRDHYQMEKRFLRRDGQVVWGQLSVSLVRNEKGEFKHSIGMVEDISERKRTEEALRQLSGRLLRLEDEERRRMARELHETVGQSLAGLAINLTVVKDSVGDLSPRASACLSESLELADQCSREIRTLCYSLHPPLVDEAGLAPALGWYTAGFARRSGIEVHLNVSPEFGQLPSEHELTLYRIVQEALTNIHRHSGSKTARISLERRPNEIVLTVADKGHGFPSAALGKAGPESADIGVGIPGMRERLRQLGGRLHIQTGSRGTTLTAILPLGQVTHGQTAVPFGG